MAAIGPFATSAGLRPDGSIVARNQSGHLSDRTGTYGDAIHRMDLRVVRRFRLYGRSTIEGSFEMFNDGPARNWSLLGTSGPTS